MFRSAKSKLFREVIVIYFSNPSCDPSDENSSENVRSRCYYAMTRTAAKDRTCLSSLGPDRYDDSDALNDQVYNAFEALNGCITCGVHCHRLCAGPPWSTYCPDGDGAEEKWQCEDCRLDFF
ncbi:unnamed protein product [Cylicostephanus goldi]|uniref:PHD-type domain-containing protein n=1 Tax=Cylicostephanus goldi TaxID=71465 RepID=A0A3P6T3G9_CYLGO|nr:unnamed protein product [Cylicostephanus goldi]